MRILQIHATYREPGGEDAAVATEAALLRDAGHQVEAYVEANPTADGAATTRLLAAPWNARAAERGRAAARRFAADVVHVHNTWFAFSPAVLTALRRDGFPVVLTLHNYRTMCAPGTLFRDGQPCLDCLPGPLPAVRHACYRGSRAQSAIAAGTIALHRRRETWARDVDHLLAISRFGRELHVRAGLPAERISVKSNSTDDPGGRPSPPSASDEVLYVGRLAPEKGVDTLLDAWRVASPPHRLTVIGDGPSRDGLVRSAPAGVTFAGRLSGAEVRDRLLRARALVFPSRWFEGQGLVGLEACAAGTPVLHSELGAMRELTDPEDDASFPAGDAASLAAALGRLSDGFVDTQGARARRRFEERYTHEQARRRLVETYDAARAHAAARP